MVDLGNFYENDFEPLSSKNTIAFQEINNVSLHQSNNDDQTVPQSVTSPTSSTNSTAETHTKRTSEAVTQTTLQIVPKQNHTKLEKKLVKSEKVIAKLRRKIKSAQQNIIRKKKKITDLKDVIKKLSDKKLISTICEKVLERNFSGVPLKMLKRMARKKTGRGVEYSNELRCFALTLQFYSTKAYEYVRRTSVGK